MTITLDLPEETFASLQAEAQEQGRSAEEVASDYLAAIYADFKVEENA